MFIEEFNFDKYLPWANVSETIEKQQCQCNFPTNYQGFEVQEYVFSDLVKQNLDLSYC